MFYCVISFRDVLISHLVVSMQAEVGEPLARKTNLPSLPSFISLSLFNVIPERTWGGKSDLTVCVRTKVLFYEKFRLSGVMWLLPKIKSWH